MVSRTILLTVLVVFAQTRLWAAGPEPEIIVKLSHSRIYQGDSVVYQVTLNNVADPSPPKLEGFDDFQITSKGEQSLDSREIYISNGRRTETIRRGHQYTYQLTPRRAGTLKIPGPVAKVNGKELRGRELTLKVIAPEEQDSVFMEITADRQSVYPTQPFAVTLSVAVKGLPEPYSEESPVAVQSSQPTLQIPWASDENIPEGLAPEVGWRSWLGRLQDRGGSGFKINDVGSSDPFSFLASPTFRPKPRRVLRADKDGGQVEYWEYRFRRTFVPRKAGQYTFGPVTLKGTFATGVNDRGNLSGEAIYAVARRIVIAVKEVPEQGRPDNYIGVVGRFRMTADVAPREAKVGDPMTVTLTLKGQGSLADAFAPDLARNPKISGRFKTGDEPSQEVEGNSCRFTYTLRPLEEGIREFPAVMASCFDVDTERYVTFRSDPVPIRVTRADRLSGSQIVATPSSTSRERNQFEVHREGIFANVTDLSAVRDQSVRPGRWLLGLGGMIGLYAVVALVSSRVQRLNADKSLLRRRGAVGRARRRLRRALAELQAQRIGEGADHVQDALVGLVADVADVPEAGLTPKDVCRQLRTFGTEEELIRRVGTLLETCDAARYGAAQAAVDGLGHQAQDVLGGMIRSLKAKKRFR